MKNLLNCCGQQQQWEAVPPYQFLESAQTATSQDPRAQSGLPGLELGAAKHIQSFSSIITQNLWDSFHSSTSCTQFQVPANIHSQSLPSIFPFPQMKTPESHSAEWILPGVKTEQPKLSSFSTFKDCLGLNWDNCHLMSHLPTFHFLGESWPQI